MKLVGEMRADSFRQAARRISSQSGAGSEAAIRVLAGVMFRKLIRLSGEAVDTGRYQRAWQTAYAQLGIEPVALTPLRESRYAKDNRDRLQRQADRWALERERWVKIVQGYERRPNHQRWKSYREALKILDKVGDLEDSAIESLAAIDRSPGEGEGPAVFIAGRKSRSATQAGRRSLRSRYALSQVARAYTKVYGGEARIFQRGNEWVVFGANREPHARIVESGERGRGAKRILSRALADARAVGFTRRAAQEFLRNATAGTTARVGDGIAAKLATP